MNELEAQNYIACVFVCSFEMRFFCVCACECLFVCLCVRVSVWVCALLFVCMCKYLFTCMCKYLFTYICVCVCVLNCIQVRVSPYTYTRRYTSQDDMAPLPPTPSHERYIIANDLRQLSALSTRNDQALLHNEIMQRIWVIPQIRDTTALITSRRCARPLPFVHCETFMLMLAGCRTPGASGGIIRGRRGDYGLGNDSVLEIVIEMTLQFVMVNVC